MKNKSYLEQIDHLLRHHRREIERLEIARQVLVQLGAHDGRTESAPAAAPETAITIRRIAEPAAEPKPKPKAAQVGRGNNASPERKAEKAAIREQVIDALRVEPQTSTALIARLLPAEAAKNQKQTVYDALYSLKLAGTLERGADKNYRIVAPAETAH